VSPPQHDNHTSNQMKIISSSLQLDVRAAIDVARFGAIITSGYDARYRTIPACISPENRILVGLARVSDGQVRRRSQLAARADERLSRTYAKIHGFKRDPWAATTPAAAPLPQ
jgi:hypothetical protein